MGTAAIGCPPSAARHPLLHIEAPLTRERGFFLLLPDSWIGKFPDSNFIRSRRITVACGTIYSEAVVSPDVVGAKQVLMVGRDTRSGPVAQPG